MPNAFRYVVVLTLLSLLLCCAQETPSNQIGNRGHLASTATPANETQLLTTLQQMYDAEKKHDIKFIRSHLSDDFIEVAGDGRVYYWKDIEPAIGDMELRDYKLTECISNFVTSDSAYLSCKMEVDALFKGNPLPRLFRVTWIWTRTRDRQWVVRFEQATIVPEATPAPRG